MHDVFTTRQVILRDELRDLLTSLDVLPSSLLGSDVYRLLQARGKLLSPSPNSRLPNGNWAFLSLALASYCAPEAEKALVHRIALLCEVLHVALDAFDEIEDDDSSPEREVLGDGRMLNAATFLYTLVPRLLRTLSPNLLLPEQVDTIEMLFFTEMASAIRGQHHDLVVEQEDLQAFPQEECMDIAAEKSGSLFRLVCRMSVSAVGASASTEQCFAEIGELMGVVAQIENDVHGLEVELSSYQNGAQFPPKSDLRRRKKTLPIVIAYAQSATALQLKLLSADKEEQREDTWNDAYTQAITASLAAAAHLRKQALTIVEQVELVLGTMPDELRMLLNIQERY